MVRVGLEPSEVTVTLPVALPAEVGANFTLKLTLCPLFSVTGSVMPVRLNPAPDAVAAVIFRLDPPELVNVSVTVSLFPTTTLPKLTEDGLADNAPSAAPLPLNGIFRVGLEPSDVTVTLPVALPVAAGANFTLKLTLCPLLSVRGKVNPLRLKPVPDAAAAVIFRLEPPEFVKVSVMVWLFPTTTLPKFREEGLADNAPSAAPLPLKEMFSVGLDPSDVIVTLPVALPAAVGANFALKLTLCPEFSVTGSARPLRLNPLPDALAPVIFKLDPPELVKVSVTV
jgi:hypothetical protein